MHLDPLPNDQLLPRGWLSGSLVLILVRRLLRRLQCHLYVGDIVGLQYDGRGDVPLDETVLLDMHRLKAVRAHRRVELHLL